MKSHLVALLIVLLATTANSQNSDPLLANWWFNANGDLHNGAMVDVEAVYHNSQYVYVLSSGIPGYYEPNRSAFEATDLANTFRITKTPQPANGSNLPTIENVPVGVLMDGSLVVSAGNGQSWKKENQWHELAYEHEGVDFDGANGHASPNHIYHHHVDPTLLYALDETQHSPIVGYAFDGYPIYGPFAYQQTDGTGAIQRMESSYQLRAMDVRTELEDGTAAPGPAIGANHPVGSYWEDYTYSAGSGHLDAHNGRWCITPEYPNGTYAYFVTLTEFFEPQFPYIVGASFYGEADTGNMGEGGADFNVPGDASEFVPGPTGLEATRNAPMVSVYPNPAQSEVHIQLRTSDAVTVSIVDAQGRTRYSYVVEGRSARLLNVPVAQLARGTYFIRVESTESSLVETLVKL